MKKNRKNTDTKRPAPSPELREVRKELVQVKEISQGLEFKLNVALLGLLLVLFVALRA